MGSITPAEHLPSIEKLLYELVRTGRGVRRYVARGDDVGAFALGQRTEDLATGLWAALRDRGVTL